MAKGTRPFRYLIGLYHKRGPGLFVCNSTRITLVLKHLLQLVQDVLVTNANVMPYTFTVVQSAFSGERQTDVQWQTRKLNVNQIHQILSFHSGFSAWRDEQRQKRLLGWYLIIPGQLVLNSSAKLPALSDRIALGLFLLSFNKASKLITLGICCVFTCMGDLGDLV